MPGSEVPFLQLHVARLRLEVEYSLADHKLRHDCCGPVVYMRRIIVVAVQDNPASTRT